MLVPELARLAHGMQTDADAREMSQVRIDYDAALAILGGDRADDIIQAGAALGVLDEDQAADEVMYSHQLVQEYFAARELAREPNPELVRAPWRVAEIRPGLREILDDLPPAEPLPPLPPDRLGGDDDPGGGDGPRPPTFLRDVMETNLALAGRPRRSRA